MVNKNKVIEILQTLLADIEEEKTDAEITQIIQDYITEKGITNGVAEKIIRDTCKEYFMNGGGGVLDDFETLLTNEVTTDEEASEAIDEIFNS